MGLLPTSFWGGWAAVLTAFGLLFLLWLSLGVYKARGIAPPPDQWDENLREGNASPPKWWFMTLFGFLIFSAAYIVLYPGLGDNTGILGWQQRAQLQEGLAYYKERTAETHARWQTAPLAQLRQDASAMASARRLYANNCAACHGDDGRGQAGLFPNLMDAEWHWGSSEEAILHSIRHGRVAAMPAWAAVLGEDGIAAMTDFLLEFNQTGQVSERHQSAHQQFIANCAACHGQQGEGNPALGSPRLKNHIWQYNDAGNIRDSITKTLRDGRGGVMPAQNGRLTDGQIRLLAAWLMGGHSLNGEQ